MMFFLFKDYKLGHKLLYNVYIEPILLGALGAWIGAINKHKGFVNVLNLITNIKMKIFMHLGIIH